ncbi:uncharacterized protein LOC143067522 [Mytilus galloprovincialis]|uniref:uncharacterized protein LOC143067522 n=1 Tax=Mytilus galloprovincialis TaxID=29158 RepID=UPI003F7C7D6F
MASQPKKSAMKKESGEKGDKSRPASSKLTKRESSAKIVNSNTNGLFSKSKQDQILKDNSELQAEVKSLKSRNLELMERLRLITTDIVEHSKSKGYKYSSSTQNMDVLDLPIGNISELIEFLTHGKDPRNRASIETRVEELETRITHLNMELAKMLELRINYEHGLDAIQNCNNLFDAQNRARFLLYETKGSRLFTFLEKDQFGVNEEEITNNHNTSTTVTTSEVKPSITHTESIIKKLKTLDLTPPINKLPGETHIKKMDKDLEQYIINELSLCKGNGADWRLFAERVGISTETVVQWKKWKLELPMKYVLETWSHSPAATMRMLHRHLVSPQLKNTLLAKRISDFYKVD